MRVLNITPCRPVDKRATVGPCPAAARRCANHEAGSSGASQTPKLATFLTAAAASVLLAQTMPAMAQLETVTAGQAMDQAQPMQARPYDKGKVWLVLIGGATGLFALTVAAENSSSLFPAISRANQAMKSTSDKAESAEAPQPSPPTVDTRVADEPKVSFEEAEMQAKSEEAVLDGLRAARGRMHEAKSGASTPPTDPDSPDTSGAVPAAVKGSESDASAVAAPRAASADAAKSSSLK